MEIAQVEGQEVIKPTVPTKKIVTWAMILNSIVKQTLFPDGADLHNIKNKIFLERGETCVTEMVNVFIFLKQRLQEDLEQEIQRLETMQVEITMEIAEASWFRFKLISNLKKEIQEAKRRIDGLNQARQIIMNSKPVPDEKQA